MEYDPKLDLKELEEITKLPQIKVEANLPESIDTLAVIVKASELSNLPAFLSSVNENDFQKEDLGKKKNLFIYGRAGDSFKRCFLRAPTFNDNVSILSEGANLARNLLAHDALSFGIYFSESITPEQASLYIQGVCLSNYKFERKFEKSSQYKRLDTITVYHPSFNLEAEQIKFNLNLAKYPLFCRELVNSRALEANPRTMLDLCKQIAQIDSKIKIETIVGKELQAQGLNLIYSVGRGAAKEPCLVILKYEGNPENAEDVIALVGKGVCFDAGGLNIKGTGNIETMYYDKGGACTVLAAFKGIVEMKMPVNIVCAMAFVENLVGPDSVHPLDIIKSYKGLTVEIGNTDAEGRLILADTMSYTQAKYKPHTLIEFSTLTGAVKTALGSTLAAIFSNNEKLTNELTRAGSQIGENLWPLPLLQDNRDNMKGTHGDLNNKSKNVAAGASNAAAFLEYFVEKGVAWVHLDIAEAAFTASDRFVYSAGATGFGVALVFGYLRNKQQKAEEKPQA